MVNDLGNPLGGAGLFNSPINSELDNRLTVLSGIYCEFKARIEARN